MQKYKETRNNKWWDAIQKCTTFVSCAFPAFSGSSRTRSSVHKLDRTSFPCSRNWWAWILTESAFYRLTCFCCLQQLASEEKLCRIVCHSAFVFLAQEGLISSFTLRDKWPISCPFIFGLKMAKAKRSSASKSYNFWEVVRNIKILTQKSEIHKYFALFFRKFWPKTDKKTVKKPTKKRRCVGSWNFACRFL